MSRKLNSNTTKKAKTTADLFNYKEKLFAGNIEDQVVIYSKPMKEKLNIKNLEQIYIEEEYLNNSNLINKLYIEGQKEGQEFIDISIKIKKSNKEVIKDFKDILYFSKNITKNKNNFTPDKNFFMEFIKKIGILERFNQCFSARLFIFTSVVSKESQFQSLIPEQFAYLYPRYFIYFSNLIGKTRNITKKIQKKFSKILRLGISDKFFDLATRSKILIGMKDMPVEDVNEFKICFDFLKKSLNDQETRISKKKLRTVLGTVIQRVPMEVAEVLQKEGILIFWEYFQILVQYRATTLEVEIFLDTKDDVLKKMNNWDEGKKIFFLRQYLEIVNSERYLAKMRKYLLEWVNAYDLIKNFLMYFTVEKMKHVRNEIFGKIFSGDFLMKYINVLAEKKNSSKMR